MYLLLLIKQHNHAITVYSSEKGIKSTLIRKTGQKASRWKFVGTTGRNAEKEDNPVLNGRMVTLH